MRIEHIAIWTSDLERSKTYYESYFGAVSNQKYHNHFKQFESYFLSFQSGARLELMYRPDIPDNLNDAVVAQYKGIIHMAFCLGTKADVDAKALELAAAGFPILDGPRTTGDGYYEFVTLDPDGNRIEVTAE